MGRDLTCKELLDTLGDYIGGELPAGARAEFDRHLSICPPCVDYLKTYEATILLARASAKESDAAPLKDAPEELIKAILAARSKLAN